MICEQCKATLKIGDYPFCKGEPSNHQPAHPVAIGDDIPGGLEIRNVLCSPDGTPRRFYSKKAIEQAAKEKGYHSHVEHVPTPGSDKNRFGHTTRWV